MEDWLKNLVEQIEEKRIKSQFWGNFHEYISYIGLTFSSICSAIAALSIATKYSAEYPFVSGFIALVPAIWLGIERGLKPRSLSSYNHSMETKLRIMRLKIEAATNLDRKQTTDLYSDFLEDEEKAFEAFMRSFDQPIVLQKTDELSGRLITSSASTTTPPVGQFLEPKR